MTRVDDMISKFARELAHMYDGYELRGVPIHLNEDFDKLEELVMPSYSISELMDELFPVKRKILISDLDKSAAIYYAQSDLDKIIRMQVQTTREELGYKYNPYLVKDRHITITNKGD